MLAKLLAALLAIFGVILLLGGVAALIKAEPNAPMFFAMLAAVVAFGIGCIVASIGVFRMHKYGFVLCIGLGISAAVFALIVSENTGQGVLWPIFVFMTTAGAAGLFSKSKSSAIAKAAP
jgi:peptidoglycan/LPS O-acetylase OafA/YrhL